MPLLTLDRVMGGRAVLVDEQGDAWEIPSAALPPGAKEGDLLSLLVKRRKGATKNLQREIQQLQEKLKNLKRNGE